TSFGVRASGSHGGNLPGYGAVGRDVGRTPGRPSVLPSTKESSRMATRGATSGTREIEGRDSVGLYLDEIARNPLLDAITEVELAKTIEAGLMAQHLLDTGRVGRAKGGAPMRATREELEWLAEEG